MNAIKSFSLPCRNVMTTASSTSFHLRNPCLRWRAASLIAWSKRPVTDSLSRRLLQKKEFDYDALSIHLPWRRRKKKLIIDLAGRQESWIEKEFKFAERRVFLISVASVVGRHMSVPGDPWGRWEHARALDNRSASHALGHQLTLLPSWPWTM